MSAFSQGQMVSSGNGRVGEVAACGATSCVVLCADGTWQALQLLGESTAVPVGNGVVALASSQAIPGGLPNLAALP